ncbi:MAG: hypothetical protein PHE00_05520 [Atribacterota bacterium]|nr:hypothetical protein [Atribacterota bacterium]
MLEYWNDGMMERCNIGIMGDTRNSRSLYNILFFFTIIAYFQFSSVP